MGSLLPPQFRKCPLQLKHAIPQFGVFRFQVKIVLEGRTQQFPVGLLAVEEQLLPIGYRVEHVSEHRHGWRNRWRRLLTGHQSIDPLLQRLIGTQSLQAIGDLVVGVSFSQ